MSPETAQAIVERVASRHPKLSPANYPQVHGDTAIMALNDMPVTHMTLGSWFSEQGALVVSVGYNVIDELWIMHFREVAET